MTNEYKTYLKKILKKAFESGFENAARSFSQMTGENVGCKDFKFCSFRFDDESFIHDITNKYELLLTTSIFGEVTGKSYLLLSDIEYVFLTKNIQGSHLASFDLKEEFIKELNNILSASVISKLSDELDQKMYGDIPIFLSNVKAEIKDFIFDDVSDHSGEVCVNSVSFCFEKHPSICPLFIWVIDSVATDKEQATI